MWKYAWSFVASFNVAVTVVFPSVMGAIFALASVGMATYEWVIWWRANGY